MLQVPAVRAGSLLKPLFLVLMLVAVASVRSVYAAVAIAGPVLFYWLGLRLSLVLPQATTLRFFPAGLEVATDGAVSRVPWASIPKVEENEAGLMIPLPLGLPIRVPRTELPTDRRALAEALPREVAIEAGPAAPTTRRRSHPLLTLMIWAVLVATFVALWGLVKSS